MSKNEQWARNIINRTDPGCRPRWEVFDSLINRVGGTDKLCLNIGSGIKEEFDLHYLFKSAFDTDVLYPENLPHRTVPFFQSDLNNLPVKDNSADLIILRFVVEHLAAPDQAFKELGRVLSPGGRVLIMTTNLMSPFIFIPKYILPYPMRKWILKKIFRAQDEDIFPTYHHMNTKRSFKKISHILETEQLIYIQDINWTHKWLFVLMYSFHLKTRYLHLPWLRSNIIAILKKN